MTSTEFAIENETITFYHVLAIAKGHMAGDDFIVDYAGQDVINTAYFLEWLGY